jgi:hypothetical protein
VLSTAWGNWKKPKSFVLKCGSIIFYPGKIKAVITMKNKSTIRIPGRLFVRVFKILFFAVGGLYLYRKKEKLATFAKNRNFIITAAYAIIISFIALIARLIMALNWILQQSR